jgi:DNA polymerase elongation subunit (family B)
MKIVETENFVIESLGVQELDVYDLEVDDTHTFFANDVLVHNSNYFSLDSLLKKFGIKGTDQEITEAVDQIYKGKMSKVVGQACTEIAEDLNVFQNCLAVKREKISSAGVFVSKKRYALNVYDDEGLRLTEPKIAVTGIEVKRSSTPKVCRDALKESLKIILNKTESDLQEYVSHLFDEFKRSDLSVIARPSGVKGLEKYGDPKRIYVEKGCPMHVRAALLYNHFIKTHNVGHKYQPIGEGNKMRYVPLIMPNPLGHDIIGFVDKLPEEFGVQEYIDYDELFDKAFLNPLKKITGACRWSHEKVSTLDAFFA